MQNETLLDTTIKSLRVTIETLTQCVCSSALDSDTTRAQQAAAALDFARSLLKKIERSQKVDGFLKAWNDEVTHLIQEINKEKNAHLREP